MIPPRPPIGGSCQWQHMMLSLEMESQMATKLKSKSAKTQRKLARKRKRLSNSKVVARSRLRPGTNAAASSKPAAASSSKQSAVLKMLRAADWSRYAN